jgi:hypothetical protein
MESKLGIELSYTLLKDKTMETGITHCSQGLKWLLLIS